jgi:hypothetical protein
MSQPNPSASPKLERIVHVCLIVVCLVSLVLLLERRFSPQSAPRSAAAIEKALLGKRLELAGADWKSSPINAVLYMNTNCHFCQESAPFYREIVNAQRGSQTRVSLAVVPVEPPDVMRQYLANEHIGIGGVYNLPSPVAGLTGTPTWLILDIDGIVRRVFFGKLDEPRQKELLEIVQAGVFSPQS